MDTVFIRGFEIDTIIGVYEHEKVQAQKIILDLEMAWDIKKAAESDLLVHTLDYNAVRLRIEKLCRDKHFELVESLAECICSTIMTEFGVAGIRLRLAKPQAIECTHDVGVLIARGRSF